MGNCISAGDAVKASAAGGLHAHEVGAEGQSWHGQSWHASGPGNAAIAAGAQDNTIKVWDACTGQLCGTLQDHKDCVTCCAISPDGTTLVSGSNDTTLKVWDLRTGQLCHTLQGHKRAVMACGISPDGANIVSDSADLTIMVWDLRTGKLRQSLTGQVEFDAVRPHLPQCMATCVSNHMLQVRDVLTLKIRHTLKGHEAVLRRHGTSPDGATLVSTGHDGPSKLLKVWDMATGNLRHTLTGHTGAVQCFSISPNSCTVVSASQDTTVKVWDLASGALRHTLAGHTASVRDCAVSPDGRTVVSWSSDMVCKVWDLDAGQLCHTLTGISSDDGCWRFGPDGATLACGSVPGHVKVWDLRRGQLLWSLSGHIGGVMCCAISAGNTTAVPMAANGTPQATARPVMEPQTQPDVTLPQDRPDRDGATEAENQVVRWQAPGAVLRQQSKLRVALVIGLASYRPTEKGGLGPLSGPTDGAFSDTQKLLQDEGFTTILHHDISSDMQGDRMGLCRAIHEFQDKLSELSRDGDVVSFFYYAGHGAFNGKHHYLLPNDCQLTVDADLQGIDFEDHVLHHMVQHARWSIAVLDCVRVGRQYYAKYAPVMVPPHHEPTVYRSDAAPTDDSIRKATAVLWRFLGLDEASTARIEAPNVPSTVVIEEVVEQVPEQQDLSTHSRRLRMHSMRLRTLEELLAASAAQQRMGPDGLLHFIKQWWHAAFRRRVSIPWLEMKANLMQTASHVLQVCGARLQEDAQEHGWPLPASQEPGIELFLDCVVLQLLDQDKDQCITLSEMKVLQELALEYTKSHGQPPPFDMGDLLHCVYECYPRTLLQNQLAPSSFLVAITQRLAVSDVIRSYNTARLLDEFLPDTRTWLFDKVMAWQQAAVEQEPGNSRMFLLLAEAGMGKSVCSAVLSLRFAAYRTQQGTQVVARHFFRVGQQSEGKVMLRSLVQQLCEQLPALALIVHDALAQLPSLDTVTMAELFDKLLLEPLQQLEQQQEAPLCALLLLDALDESTDSGRGWEPVCNLVATQFQRLPSWVCVMVTGRPQVGDHFASWRPQWIAADDSNNLTDLRELLLAKLRLSQLVEADQLDAAADLLLVKSQGQFIYAKYVFNVLVEQRHWSLEQLQQLPDGLTQVYYYQLDTIATALLQAGKPHLLPNLQHKLLPMLAVMKEALSVSVLAWLTKAPEADVQLLLQLLHSLFPSRPGPDGTTVVAPYHKSIQDFMLFEPGQAPAPAAQQQWRTPAAEAHGLFIARLLPELQATQLRHWQDKCGPQVLRDLPAGQQYCLQYLVDHIALAQDWAALHMLLRHLPGLKAVLEVPGQVYKLIRVLADAMSGCQDAGWQQHFRSVHRFLRASCNVINTQPNSILQDMAYSPCDCVLGDWCEQDYHVRQAVPGSDQRAWAAAFWRGACLIRARAEHFPAQVATLQGHTEKVCCCAISPDGQLLVSGSADNTLKVWDLATGQLRTTLQGHDGSVQCCAISNDAQLLVSGSHDNTLKVWDLATGQLRMTLLAHIDVVACCAISPDSQVLVSGSWDKTLKVWDLATGQLRVTLEGHTGGVSCCAISPDGQLLVAGSVDKAVKVWDLATGQLRCTLEGHTDQVRCCAISPDGQLLVPESVGNTLKVWDLATGQLRTTLQGEGSAEHETFEEHEGFCAMSADGRLLATAYVKSSLLATGYVKVWDLVTGQLRTTLGSYTMGATCCAISPHGQLLVSGSLDKTLTVWDLQAATQADVHAAASDTHVLCGTISPDGQLLACGSYDTTLQVWDLATGQLRSILEGHTGGVGCCAISPDGQLLVSGSADNTLKVWDLATGQLRSTLEGHIGAVYCCAISHDGQLLVSGSEDDTVKVWDLATGQLRTTLLGHTGGVHHCALSPDGHLLVSVSGDDTFKVWDLVTGLLRTTLDGHDEMVKCCAISPDGTLLVSGFADKTLKVWDLATGQLRSTLEGHTGGVACCAISPDGQLLVSGSEDFTLKVWDLASGQLHATLEGHTDDVFYCAISADGQLLVSGSYDRTSKVYTGNWQQAGSTIQPHSPLFTQWGYRVGRYVL